MLNYNEFLKTITNEITLEAQKKNKEATINVIKVNKLNDVELDGLVINDGDNVSPTVYLQQLYGDYCRGISIPSIKKEILRMLDQKFNMEFDVTKVSEWDYIKDKVVFNVIGKENNTTIQDKCPTSTKEDLLITYNINVSDKDGERAAIRINNELLNGLKIDKEELHNAALINTPTICPVAIKSMSESIDSMLDGKSISSGKNLELTEQLKSLNKEDIMYILTNTSMIDGATTMLYPHVLEKISEQFHDNLIILPSSRHEVLLIPEKYTKSLSELESMVKHINYTEVAPQDQLTNTVYYFDKDTNELYKAKDRINSISNTKDKQSINSISQSSQRKKDRGMKLN